LFPYAGSILKGTKPTDPLDTGERHRRAGVARLLGLWLLVADRLLCGLKSLHGPSEACHGAFERHNFGGGLIQLMSRVEPILDHEPMQKVDVALKAPGSLIQPRGFRAVFYPCAHPASTPTTIRLKPRSAILTMLTPFHSVSRGNVISGTCVLIPVML